MSHKSNLFKIALLLFGTFLFHFNTHSQPNVTKGASHRITTKEGWSYIDPIGTDNSGTYYILYSFAKVYEGAYIGSKDSYIGKVDNQMNLDNVEVIDLSYEDKELTLEFGIELHNTTYIFSSFENNALKKAFLFAQTLDRNTLKLNKDFIKVAEIDYSKENKYKNMSFDYQLSPDKSKVMFSHNLLDKDGQLLEFGYSVADNQLKILGTVNGIHLPDEGIYDFQEFQVANTGEVYLLTKYFAENKTYNQNTHLEKQGILSNTRSLEIEANFQYKILAFKQFTSLPKVATLSSEAGFITSLTFFPKQDGSLMCIGFYSDNGDALPDGVFTQNLDKTLKVSFTDTKHLAGQFDQPSKYVNDTYVPTGLIKTRDDLTSYRFVLKDILPKKSGGYALAAERTSTLTKTQRTQQSVSVITIYHTDDIVVIDTDETGKINRTSKVEKSQESASLGTLYTSFGFAEYNNNILLFFTDFSQHNLKAFGKVIDTESSLVTINTQGEAKKEVLFTADKDDITIKPEHFYERKEGSYILYGHNGQAIVGFVGVQL